VKTITLVAYKRPVYAAEVLRNLACCRKIDQFDQLLIFIDPGYDEVADVCHEFSNKLTIPVKVKVNEQLLGVAGNPMRAYSRVFDELGTDFNVAIEDDAVLSPDALELALWFCSHHGSADSRYTFLNFCDHYNYRGAGRNKGNAPDDLSLIAESTFFTSPFAWCFTRDAWPFVKRNWNRNQRSINGWDWSIRFAMRMEGRISLTPVVSRCQNIGELDGTWETGETFWVQRGLRYSDGSYHGDFALVNPVTQREAVVVDRWMIPELARYIAEREALRGHADGSGITHFTMDRHA